MTIIVVVVSSNMHDYLVNLSSFTLHKLIDEEKCKKLFEDLNVFPTEGTATECSCGLDLLVERDSNLKHGFRWKCDPCMKIYSATKGTFFENTRLSFSDYAALIFLFVTDEGTNKGWETFNVWRKDNKKPKINKNNYIQFMKRCRDVADVIASHYFYGQIGDPNCTIELDETFLTKHKYHRGRLTEGMTKTIFGIRCREDKKTLFFMVNGKSKEDLWPIVKKYVHPDISVICTDGGTQYIGIEEMFKNATHKVVIHKDTFVDKQDKTNHINGIESDNRYLKKAIRSRKNDEQINSQMHNFIYRRHRFTADMSTGQKMHRFLQDISVVFPGLTKEPLMWLDIDNPTSEEMGIVEFMPLRDSNKTRKGKKRKCTASCGQENKK